MELSCEVEFKVEVEVVVVVVVVGSGRGGSTFLPDSTQSSQLKVSTETQYAKARVSVKRRKEGSINLKLLKSTALIP